MGIILLFFLRSSHEFCTSCLSLPLEPYHRVYMRVGLMPLGMLFSFWQMQFLEGFLTAPWWMSRHRFEGLFLLSLHVQSHQQLLLLAAFHTNLSYSPRPQQKKNNKKLLEVACPTYNSFQKANKKLDKSSIKLTLIIKIFSQDFQGKNLVIIH